MQSFIELASMDPEILFFLGGGVPKGPPPGPLNDKKSLDQLGLALSGFARWKVRAFAYEAH